MEFYTYDNRRHKKPIDILIGCPIQARSWMFDLYMKHIQNACKTVGLNPGFIFVLNRREYLLIEMMKNLCKLNQNDLFLVFVEEEDRGDNRDWNEKRYKKMVWLRNLLLKGVREINPPLFLSLDSDILLHEDSIKSMIENFDEKYAATSGKVYLTHIGKNHSNYANLIQNNLHRPDSDGIFQCDVLMAVVLMREKAYNVDYKFDPQGEDIGHAKALKDKGLKLLFNGSVISKHVMRRMDLDRVDLRCGY